jgi:hypothetical protein
MAAAVATEHGRSFRGVVIVGARRARELRSSASPIRAGDLVGRSGEFHAGEWLYVTGRGSDGGQSVLATGMAVVDFDRLAGLDPDAPVISHVELKWRGAGGES